MVFRICIKYNQEKELNKYNFISYKDDKYIYFKPHSDFPYTSMDCQEFKKCGALENLRPLEAKQNILDGCTRIRHKIKNK